MNLSCLALSTGWLWLSFPVLAADSVAESGASLPVIPKNKLRHLGKQFLNKIGKGLETADLMMSGAGKVVLAERRSGTRIPEEEPLLLMGQVGKYKLNLKNEIYSLKKGTRLFLSFGEFCNAVDFAIAVSAANGTAEGWFIREDQRLYLDAKKGEISIMGVTAKINPEDLLLTPDDLLVSSALLEKWFGISFDYNFADMRLKIQTSQLFPMEEKYLRDKITGGKGLNVGPAKLPFLKEPYRLASKPYIDITTTVGRARASGNNDFTNYGAWTALAHNDFAGYSMESFANGNGRLPLQAVRTTLSRADENGELLGPLRATYYQFGDVGTIPVTLVDSGAQEQGVALTNRPANTSMATSTEIRGNALPDWDVELYRNDSFIGIQRIDGRGQYAFESVPLYIGNNDFKILFLGPQGEIREEHRKILVDPSQFESNKGYYTFSASRQYTNTWQAIDPEGPDVGATHLAGTYQYAFGSFGTAEIGARTRSDNGEQREFIETGLTTYLYDTLFNFNSGYDLTEFQSGSTFAARHNFGVNRTSLQISGNSSGFNPNNTPDPTITRYSVNLGAVGPVDDNIMDIPDDFQIRNLVYNVGGGFRTTYRNSQGYNLTGALTGRYTNINLSTSLNYINNISDASEREMMTWNLGGRGFYKGGLWALGSSYNVIPLNQLTTINGEYAYNLAKNLRADFKVKQVLDPMVTDGSVTLNWVTKKAIISPKIETNTNEKLRMSVNVHFGLAPEPYSGSYHMIGKSLSSSGGVAARIFIDKNGDGLYNDGDELLPETGIKSLQSNRKSKSDEKGIAFIPDLPVGLTTDIIIDPEAMPDVTYLSLFEGLSIRPRQGIVSQIEFPIVISGDLDGNGFIDRGGNSRMAARNVSVSLVAPDGRVEKTADVAYDGYYSINGIRPGLYYLTVNTDRSETDAYMLPQKIYFDPTGTTLYGRDLMLTQGANIKYLFSAADKMKLPITRARVEKESDIAGEEILIHLGPYHSRLGMTFSWYKFKIRSHPWENYFNLVTPLSKIEADPRTGEMELVLKPEHPLTMVEGTRTCLTLIDMKFDCSVEVVSQYAYDRSRPTADAGHTLGKKEQKYPN